MSKIPYYENKGNFNSSLCDYDFIRIIQIIKSKYFSQNIDFGM